MANSRTAYHLAFAILLVNLIIGLPAVLCIFLSSMYLSLYTDGLRSDFVRFDQAGIINTDLMNEHFGAASAIEWWQWQPGPILAQLSTQVWLCFLAFASLVLLNIATCALLRKSIRDRRNIGPTTTVPRQPSPAGVL